MDFNNKTNKGITLNEEFKALLLETLREVQKHPDGVNGIVFITNFDEEPDWEVGLMFRPKSN